MIVISPLLAFLYLLLASVFVTRFLRAKGHRLFLFINHLSQQALHLSYKKQQLVLRPKAVRFH